MTPTEMPLKRKYRIGGKGRYRSGYGGNNRAAKAHRKLTEREIALHLAQPVKVMVMSPSGKLRMTTA